MRLHVKNLQLLSKSVPELEEDIPKISDLEESVLDCLRNMRNVLKKVSHLKISQINKKMLFLFLKTYSWVSDIVILTPFLVSCIVFS